MKRYVPFFISFTLLLVGAHYIVYLLLSSAWSALLIQNVILRTILALLLSFCFIGASFAVSKSNNPIVQFIYLLTALWLGLFFYLFFGAVIWGILIFFFGHIQGIAQISAVTAFLIAFYGVLNASIIKKKIYEISINGLPDAWKDRKIVMLSDLHFGAVNGARYAKRIVKEIENLHPDIVFIVGDFFDGVKVDEKAFSDIFSELKPKDGIFFVMGNHDEFRDNTKEEKLLRGAGMIILNNEKVELDGIQIIGVDYKTTIKKEDLERVLRAASINHSIPSILLRHVPTHIDTAEKFGISLVLSGHTHNGQIYPANFIASRVHKGFGYGLKRLHDTQVLISSGIGTWGPPLRVGTQSELLIIKLK